MDGGSLVYVCGKDLTLWFNSTRLYKQKEHHSCGLPYFRRYLFVCFVENQLKLEVERWNFCKIEFCVVEVFSNKIEKFFNILQEDFTTFLWYFHRIRFVDGFSPPLYLAYQANITS